ncbi:MAG: UDP-N-acetylmuramoyl-tripeptide--D-alanyl-D-alanine ligase, partial [Deltaproteobacteria bacterium]|nr:UDP-N-acetylmuramoyl-tripeptide--D-alanyl-D-alanine ligase [Deltaproteobacteria bacterium]
AAAAAAAAWALGLRPQEIALGLGTVTVTPGRTQVLPPLARGVRVIDDTYNANPASMRAAFKALAALAHKSRRVAVLGDMLELGSDAAALHREVGQAAAELGVDWLLSLGEHAAVSAAAAAERGTRAQAFSDVEALVEALVSGLGQGDWVVVKGSRGAKMERVVAALTQRLVP